MIVTVNDRAADAAYWGSGGLFTPILRTVEIADTCPQCGGPRGKPEKRRYVEDGAWYVVDNWTNACGHVDCYAAVLAEADRLAAEKASVTAQTTQADAATTDIDRQFWGIVRPEGTI